MTVEKERERWLARFQVRLVTQPGVDRGVVLEAVKEVNGHCAVTGEEPGEAFGDADAYAVVVAGRLVPEGRAAEARRREEKAGVVGAVLKKIRDIGGLLGG